MRRLYVGSCAAWLLALLTGALLAPAASAAEKIAAEILPASVVAYLDVPEPGKVVGLVLDHPLAGEVAQAPEYQKALDSPPVRHVQEVLAQLEMRLGAKWRDALGSLTGGGLTVAFDLPTQGVVVLAQGRDEQFTANALAALLDLGRAVGAEHGNQNLVREDKHADAPIFQIGEAHLAARGKWLIVTNKKPLLRTVIDLSQESPDSQAKETLAADGQYQKVRGQRPEHAAAWLYADLRVLRLAGVLKKALDKKSDNPPVEIVAGGVIGAVPDAPYVTASLDLSPTQIKLTAALPCNPKAVAKSREFYLGPEAAGRAPPLLSPPGTLLAIATYRDFASLWRHAPDLFDEGINAKLAEVESNLTTFFAGRNFRDDILGNLEPGVQVVAARQQFPQEGVTPAIKLPAVAAVLRMKQPKETARIFKVTFQSALGFLNVVGAQNGVDPLDLNIEKAGETLIISGAYLPPAEGKSADEAPLHYNASPTIVFAGDRCIIASARPLALAVLEQLGKEGPAAPTGGVTASTNTAVRLDGRVGQAALSENRQPLIAQNMLQKGHDRAAAEQEIDRVLSALRVLEGASLDLAVAESKLRLTLQIDLAGEKSGGK